MERKVGWKFDIGHWTIESPSPMSMSTIQLTSNVICPISNIQLTSRFCGNTIFFFFYHSKVLFFKDSRSSDKCLYFHH